MQVAINNWNDGVKDEITRLVKQDGINAFKFSMADGDKMFKNDSDMLDAFAACRQVGAVVGVHAELGAVIAENEKRLTARGVTGRSVSHVPKCFNGGKCQIQPETLGPEGHLMARPQEIEESAVMTAISMARQANVPLVVNGPTSARAASIIGREKKKGQMVLGEPTAASLAVDGSHYFKVRCCCYLEVVTL